MEAKYYDKALKIAIRALRVSADSGSICSNNSDKALEEMATTLKTNKDLLIARIDDKAF